MSLRPLLKRHTFWLGFLAVLAPLALLLVFQYRWLVKLEHASQVANQATLDNYLEAVAAEVEYVYRSAAERALNLPAALFSNGRLQKAALHFKKKEIPGVRRLFVVPLLGEDAGRPYFFDPATIALYEPEWSPEVQAVYVATAPWKILAHKGGTLEQVQPVVEEKDPDHRIILYPVTDDAWKPVGVAGMVLDAEHLRVRLLPAVVEKSVPEFFPGGRDAPILTLDTGEEQCVLGKPGETAKPPEAERAFSFVYTDWKLGLRSRHATPADWARSNFLINIGLSGALALVLLGGVALALRTASREVRLSEMKSDFVSNVSHELRTPLASIRVFGELLRLGRVESPERAREYGEYIETESRRLTQLINNILDFASIESGRKRYRFELADLGDVVADTLRTFEVRLKQRGFRLAFQRPPEPLPPAHMDTAALTLCLSNLLDNAVKFSGDSQEIEVTLRRDAEDLVLSVADRGIGIPRGEQQKIFERFHRVSTGLVHDAKGSGLGLAIVQHIVQAHGGRVAVESRPGEGSTFTLRLPAARAGTKAAEAPGWGPEAGPGRVAEV